MQILTAIPKETGKVIIVEGEEDKYRDVTRVIIGAGFTVKDIGSIISIIEAYPWNLHFQPYIHNNKEYFDFTTRVYDWITILIMYTVRC